MEARGVVNAVAFSPDGRTALTASARLDRAALGWSRPGSPGGAALKHEGAVNAVAFSPDGGPP